MKTYPSWPRVGSSSLLSHFQALFLLFSLFHVSPAVISLVVFRHLQPWTPPVLRFPALKEPHSTGAHPSTQQSPRWDAVVSPPLPRTFRVLWKMSHTFKHTRREGQVPYPKPGTPTSSLESRLPGRAACCIPRRWQELGVAGGGCWAGSRCSPSRGEAWRLVIGVAGPPPRLRALLPASAWALPPWGEPQALQQMSAGPTLLYPAWSSLSPSR